MLSAKRRLGSGVMTVFSPVKVTMTRVGIRNYTCWYFVLECVGFPGLRFLVSTPDRVVRSRRSRSESSQLFAHSSIIIQWGDPSRPRSRYSHYQTVWAKVATSQRGIIRVSDFQWFPHVPSSDRPVATRGPMGSFSLRTMWIWVLPDLKKRASVESPCCTST